VTFTSVKQLRVYALTPESWSSQYIAGFDRLDRSPDVSGNDDEIPYRFLVQHGILHAYWQVRLN
jgi:hypothetical protein